LSHGQRPALVVTDGVKKPHTPAKMLGRLGTCGLVIYEVTFKKSNIQGKLILREKFIYVHTHILQIHPL
jgi:hypothetical protein